MFNFKMKKNIYKEQTTKDNMPNKDRAINQKISLERNKSVWLIKDSNNKVIDSFRSKTLADSKLRKLNNEGFEFYTLERDNSFRTNLKEVINENKSKV